MRAQPKPEFALFCCALLFLASWFAPAHCAPASAYAGRPLAEVLESLRAAGLDLLYSSQLVHPEMRVLKEPRAQSAPAVLAEILAPHGLEARQSGENRYLIVRAPAVRSTRDDAGAAAVIDPRTLDEVLVHASRYELRREDGLSVTVLDRQRLDAIPGVEQDVIRALQRIPGSASGGLSATTHVRGSYDDEVLIRFDGVRLYEPFHLKDFLNLFGTVDPELVDTVAVFSGGFPAEYGDRAGGVLDIVPRTTGGAEHLIGTSVLNNRAISSGSHSGGRGHWLAGYRRGNLLPVLHQIERDVGEPRFEDILVRYSYRVAPSLTAAVGFLALEDDHRLFTEDRDQEAEAGYSDDAVWLRLDFNQDLWSLGLHAAHSHLSAQRRGTAFREGVSEGSLNESRVTTIDDVRLEWSLRRWDRLHWRGGVDLARSKVAYDYSADATFESPLVEAFARPDTLTQRVQRRIDGNSYGPWVSARGELGDATLEVGLRYDERTWLDRGGQWSPRASIRYDLDDKTVLRASGGRFLQSQTLNELEVEETDPQFASPESSRQLIVGLERRLPLALRLRIEAFDRHMRGVRPRFENVLNPLVLLPEIELDRVRIAPLSSRVRGIELMLQSDPAAPLSWWASYTWSRSDDRFGDGEAARSWDQRNAAYVGATWRRDPWLIGAVAAHISGWPFTDLQFTGPPQGAAAGFSEALLGPRNRVRFPDRAILDVRAQYSLALPRGELEFILEVRNALGEGNDCCRDIDIETLPDGAYSAEIEQKKWLPLLPIVGINWRF